MRLRVLLISLLLFSIVPKGTPTFAATATMSVDMPASVNQGVKFSADLVVNPCSSHSIFAATIYLTFDKDVLNVVDAAGEPVDHLTPSADYPQVMENVVDNSAGTIHYSAGSFTGHDYPTTIVTIYFKAPPAGVGQLYGKKTTAVNFDSPNCAVLVDYTIEITSSSGLTLVNDTVDILDNVKPAIPTGFGGSAGNGLVNLVWNLNSEADISKYKIYQASGETEPPDTSFALKTTVNHPTQVKQISGLANGTTYWYKITAVDTSDNESVRSTAISLTPQEKIVNPPTNVSATQATPYDEHKELVITWTAPTTYSNGDPLVVSGYNVYRASGATDPYPSGYAKRNISLVTTTSYTDSSALVRNTKYWYRIEALDNSSPPLKSDRGACTPASITFQDPTPGIPSGLQATPGNQKVDLSWNANNEPDFLQYNIYQASGEPAGSYVKITGAEGVRPKTTTTYTKTNLTNGTLYWYKISAVDDGSNDPAGSNESNPSSAVRVKVPEETPPKVLSASTTAGDATHVNVVFDESLDYTTSSTAGNYTITGNPEGLTVSAAQLQGDYQTVKLTTSLQVEGRSYTVTVLGVEDQWHNPITGPPNNSADFLGAEPPDTDPPTITPPGTTAAVNNTTVNVIFNEKVGAGANTKTNYTITPTLTVTAAELQAGELTVKLTTAQQGNKKYKVTVKNVKDLANNTIVNNGVSNVCEFDGIPPEYDPPKVTQAESLDATHVMVYFDEELDILSANNKANYTIDNGITVNSAQIQSGYQKVKLTTTTLSGGLSYTVTVLGVKDKWGNEITGPPNNSATFPGPDTIPPTITPPGTTTALDNTHLEVVFSEKVDLTTSQNKANYTITPTLSISEALRGSSPNDHKVTLTTASQPTNDTYTVRVVNVKDQSNNVIVNNGTSNVATFVGIPSDQTGPWVITTATAPDSTHVEVDFNEEVRTADANTKTNYLIDGGLTVTGAALQTGNKKVRLTHTPAQVKDNAYVVTVSNVRDIAGNVVSPAHNTANFTGVETLDTFPPKVQSAEAKIISNELYLDVVFDEGVEQASAETIGNYSFWPSLTVTQAVRQEDLVTVRLSIGATPAMVKDQSYTVTVTNVKDLAVPSNTISGNNTANFTGIEPPDKTPPTVISATATGEAQVEVLFNENLDPTSANDKNNYAIDNGITVLSAQLQGDFKTVLLTTTTLTEGISYTLTVTGVKDEAGNPITTPVNKSFSGPDTTPPEVLSAQAFTYTEVEITFSEELDETTAETAANYTLEPSLTVAAAQLQTDKTKVKLTTSAQEYKTPYTITISNVEDLAGNPIPPGSNVGFVGKAQDSTPPTVVSAQAVGNTQVEVVFNEELDMSSVEIAGNYAITGGDGLTVLSASLQADNKTALLTTSVQNETVLYTVTAANVMDLYENVIAGSNSADFKGGDIIPPKLDQVYADTKTKVIVVFTEKVSDATATVKANYSITPSLNITNVLIQSNKTTVELTTEAQGDENYTLRVSNVKDLANNPISADPADCEKTFQGIPGDKTPPQVSSAYSLDSRHISLLFNEAVQSNSAQTASNYSLNPEVGISGAQLQSDKLTVKITTAQDLVDGLSYTITVNGVLDLEGNNVSTANPDTGLVYNTASFKVDHKSPALLSATPIMNTEVDLLFDEEIDEGTAEVGANYIFNPSLTVSSALLQSDNKTVKITTSAQEVGREYTVTVNNVKDLNNNTIDSAHKTATFTAIPDIHYPQVTNANALDDAVTVMVTFSKEVTKESAERLTFTQDEVEYNTYKITPSLNVTGAQLQEGNKIVRLTTALQSSAYYTLTVVGVSDTEEPANLIPISGAVNNARSFQGGGTGPGPEEPEITSLSITPEIIRVAPGAKTRLAAKDENGNDLSRSSGCVWSVEPASLGEVKFDYLGMTFIAGAGGGEGKIKAVYTNPSGNKVFAEIPVEINQGLSIDPATIKLKNSSEVEILGRPFNPETDGNLCIHYDLSQQVPTPTVLVRIYNLSGNLIRDNIYGDTEKAVWDFRDNAGRKVPNGVYIYQITATNINGSTHTKAKLVGVFR